MLSDPSQRSRHSGAGAGTAAGRHTKIVASEGAPEGAPSVVSAPVAASSAGRRLLFGLGRQILIALVVLLWIGVVVYPDPRPFFSSVARLKEPPIDKEAVTGLAASLPADYKTIENFTLAYVPFAPAWEVYGLPWYFPTVAEVVRDKAGDCQARAILLGSILEAKGMPYTMYYSFDHVWIDYSGKQATRLDDPSTSFLGDSGKGWLGGLPDRLPLRSIVEARVAYHWTPMPVTQKILLVLGLLLIVGYGERRLLRRMGGAMARLRKTLTAAPGASGAG